MNVREMHIEVNQQLQKVAAHRTRKFLPEETDLVLNKMVNRLIQLQLRPRPNGNFELDQLGTDVIRNLIVPNKTMKAYYQAGEGYTTYLPADYAYLISDASSVHNLCGRTATDKPVTLSITPFSLGLSNKPGPKYYSSMEISLGPNQYFLPASLTAMADYTGYSDKKDIAFLIPHILAFFHRKWVPLYWERFGDLYMPNHFLWVSPTGTAVQIKVDGITVLPAATITQSRIVHESVRETRVANRLTPSDEAHQLNNAAFYRSSALSPITELSGNFLRTYADGSFIVTGTAITYVRQPQNISLALGTDCDLAPEFHQKICDLAVENIKGTLDDQLGTQLKAQDNDRRVII